MKTFYTFSFLLCTLVSLSQKKWTGAGGDGNWSTAANWNSGTVPATTDDVILDNTSVTGSYIVTLLNTAVTLRSVSVTPATGNTITLLLPTSNTLHPALTLTSPGNVITLNNGGVFKNSSGASSSSPDVIAINSTDSIRINNGGKYVHNNARAHAYLIDQLSTASGTEKGIFKFDVPGAGGYTLSLTGNKYGTLELSADSAGGTKTYTGSGASDLIIRGDLVVNSGVSFNSTMTANINIAGNLVMNGNFDNSPGTAAATGRSILFNGTSGQTINGPGNFTFGPNFRNIEASAGSTINLQRGINLTNAGNLFLVNSNSTLQTGSNVINGIGTFRLNSNGNLGIGSANGIAATTATGNIQTDTRDFNAGANYEYNSSSAQVTGDGLPATINGLKINNSNSVSLTNSTLVSSLLTLVSGNLITTAGQVLTLDNTAIVSSSSDIYGKTDEGNGGSYIDGPMKINMNTAATKAAPLFLPVRIQKINSGAVTYTIQYFHSKYPDLTAEPPLDHVSGIEYWSVLSNVSGTISDAKLTLSWWPASSVGNFAPYYNPSKALADLTIAHYYNDGSGTKWNMEGGSFATFNTASVYGTSNIGYGTIAQSNFVSSSFISNPIFTLGTMSEFNALPLTLINFSCQAEKPSVKLSWDTENENTVDKYIIERSGGGIYFTPVDSLISLQKTAGWHYTFFDGRPLAGWNYYRLTIIDTRNKISYSKITRAWLGEDILTIFPNPAGKEIHIEMPSSGSVSDIEIVNSTGAVIQRLQTTSSSATINIESLSKGMYLLHFRNQLQSVSQRFIKR